MGTRIKHAFLFYIPCFIVQTVAGMITQQSVTTWYATLTKSALTPPGYVFGIVWTLLYALMAVAAGRVYGARGTANSRSLVWWGIQLVLGLIWTTTFFGERNIDRALAIIILNALVVVLVIQRFWRIDRLAARLMMPLLVWLSFATYLNAYIVVQN